MISVIINVIVKDIIKQLLNLLIEIYRFVSGSWINYLPLHVFDFVVLIG